MLVSLVVMVAGLAGVGWWISGQIENGVVQQSATMTALYVDSFIRPYIEELGQTGELSTESTDALGKVLKETPFGEQIVALKIWGKGGLVLYSTDPGTIGQTFPVHDHLRRAWRGQVAAHISNLDEVENAAQRQVRPRLLETYSPVRLPGVEQILVVAEFYQTVDALEREIAASQRRSWLIVGSVMLVIYLVLAAFVRRTTMATQELHDRVRRAAASATASNERFLRRVSAELHDGPIQDLGYALLRIDHVIAHTETHPITAGPSAPAGQAAPEILADELGAARDRQAGESGLHPGQAGGLQEDLQGIRASLQRALTEVRAIGRGLGLPQLTEWTPEETIRRAVRDHERRTGTSVRLELKQLPPNAPIPVRITLYRVVQEALNNAYRHAAGAGQRVLAAQENQALRVEIWDEGPGFDSGQAYDREQHLGLAGMRERVESLGGRLRVTSAAGRGTHVLAYLPLTHDEDQHGG
jgi:signal transduction histidine kinase